MWKWLHKIRSFRSKLGDLNPTPPCSGKESTCNGDDQQLVAYSCTEPEWNRSDFHHRSSPKHPHCTLYGAAWSTMAIIGLQVFFHEKRRRSCWILKDHERLRGCPFGQLRRFHHYGPLLGTSLKFSVLPSSSEYACFPGEQQDEAEAHVHEADDESGSMSFPRHKEYQQQETTSDELPLLDCQTSTCPTLEESLKSVEAAGDACVADLHNTLGLELCETEDASQALEFFEAGCALGNEKACFNAAVCYEQGIGTRPDTSKAMHFYRLAASKGHLNAIYNLGTFLYEGKGGSKDTISAKLLFQTAAEQGLTEAQRTLGICHLDEGKASDAVPLLQAASRQQDEEAHYYLGLCYENGWGVEESFSKACRYYRKAAEKRHPHATYNLAVLTEFGLGVPRDRDTALDLYRDAANVGSEEAQRRLEEFSETDTTGTFPTTLQEPMPFYRSSELTCSASFPNLHLPSSRCTYLPRSNSYALIHAPQFELVPHPHHHLDRDVQILCQ